MLNLEIELFEGKPKSNQEILDGLIKKFNNFEFEIVDEITIYKIKALRKEIEDFMRVNPDLVTKVPMKRLGYRLDYGYSTLI